MVATGKCEPVRESPKEIFLKNKMWAVSHGSFLTQCLRKEKCDPSPCQNSSILSSRNPIIGSISENTVSELRFPRVQRQNVFSSKTCNLLLQRFNTFQCKPLPQSPAQQQSGELCVPQRRGRWNSASARIIESNKWDLILLFCFLPLVC